MGMNLRRPIVAIAFVLACSILGTNARAEVPAVDGLSSSVSKTQHEKPVSPADRPTFAVELAASPAAFGQGLVPGRPDAAAMGTSLHLEYQPGFLQSLGTFGAGPVFAGYPISQSQGLTSYFFSVWSVGAAARYQARYFHNQFLVPSIGYEIDRITYSFTTGQSGLMTVEGPVLGLQFLLNTLDSRRADEFYDTTGISHTYLVAEARDLTGTNGTITASGLSWYFGLRFEM